MSRCKTPLATLRAQKCKNEGPGSGGGAHIWHQIASSAPPVHFHSSLLSGNDDSRKLSLDLHRYPTSVKYENCYSAFEAIRQHVEDT